MIGTITDLVAVWRSQLRTTEHPPNSNCQPYSHDLGLPCTFWCAIFQAWCFIRVGVDMKRYLGSGIASTEAWARLPKTHPEAWVEVPIADARVGDVFLYNFGERKRWPIPEHIGGCTAVQARGTFLAVEGNTGGGSQSNGGKVDERIRTKAVIVKVIRFIGWAGTTPAPAPAPTPAPPVDTTPKKKDMPMLVRNSKTGEVWALADNFTRKPVPNPEYAAVLAARLGPPIEYSSQREWDVLLSFYDVAT